MISLTPEASPFQISSQGVITICSPLSSSSFHPVNVTICDSGAPVMCSSRSILINVIPSTKNPICYPDFFVLYEHSPIGTAIGAYSAEDPNGHLLQYAVANTTQIAIHPLTGELLVKEDIDFETTLNHTLSIPILVSKMLNSSFACQSTIYIQILDVPESPRFVETDNWSGSNRSHVLSVPETIPVHTLLGNKLNYTDPDLNDPVVYSLRCLTVPSPCPFNISQQGFVEVAVEGVIDFETLDKWILEATVTDSYGLSDSVKLIVLIEDVNEEPSFSQTTVYRVGSLPLSSNEVIGTPVLATDPEGDSLAYTIDSELFSIDNLGQIRLVDTTINPSITYNVTVHASDPSGLSCSVFAIISFTGEHPLFSIQHSVLSIPESSPAGTILHPSVRVSGVYSAPLSFEILSGANGVFALNATTGFFTQLSSLDYETQPSYSLSILATDRYGLQASGVVDVVVLDVNEPPAFQESSCSAVRVVSEKSPTNTFLPPALFAVDPDHDDTVVYSIDRLHDSDPLLPFSVDSALGTLFVSNGSLLNFDENDHYEFVATATDSQGLSDSCYVHVSVLRERRQPTIVFIQKDVYIRESTDVNSTISVPSYVKSDNSSQLMFYANCSEPVLPSCPFGSTGNSSYLVLKDSLDYENRTDYGVTICVMDDLLLSICENVTIHVVDVDEPPYFTNVTSPVTIDEDTIPGSVVTRVEAVDPEGSGIHYSVSGDDHVTIDSETGEIRLVKEVDAIITPSLNVTVVALDETGYSSTAQVIIVVRAINQPPVCMNAMGVEPIYLYENITIGSVVGLVNTTDREVKRGDQLLSFRLLTDTETFRVNAEGILSLRSSLNYWNRSSYTLLVEVSDNGEPILSTICSVQINVLDINTPPSIILANSTIYVAENHTTYKPIPLDISVHDDDFGQANYFFVVDNPLFGIDPVSGALFHRQELDYETQSIHVVTIGVGDLSNSPLFDYVNITIVVDDVNEPPTQLTHQMTVWESASVGSLVGIIRTSDPDTGANGVVRCIQRNLLDIFHINPDACSVTLEKTIDYETKSEYLLQLVLVDGGGIQVNGFVQVAVLDVNEPPRIIGLTPNITVDSSTQPGTIIGSLFIVEDPEEDPVTIICSDSRFGVIRTETGQYALTMNTTISSTEDIVFSVVASDDHELHSSVSVTVSFTAEVIQPIMVPLQCAMPEHTPIDTILSNCTLTLQNADSFARVEFSQEFSIASTAFSIVGWTNHTARVRVAEDTDYETYSHYVIPLSFAATSLQNGLILSGVGFVTVDLEDVNEPPMFVGGPYSIQVEEGIPENTQLRPCLQAIDEDEDDKDSSPLYSLESGNAWIGIHSTTGCLFMKRGDLDYENPLHPKSWLLRVFAMDRHNAYSATTVNITVIDANEPPQFSENAYYFTLQTPVSPSTAFGYPIVATDPDSPSSLVYSIEHQSCLGAFTVNPQSGRLSTSSVIVPDLVITDSSDRFCVVHLIVTDQGGLTDATVVYVSVLSNVHPPVISPVDFTVDENPTVGEVIASLTAESRCSAAEGGWIEFFLLDSMFNNVVQIQNGTLLTVLDPSVFDYEVRDSISLAVTAVDHGCFNATSTTQVTIHITDVNEPPLIGNYSYHIPRDSTYPLVLSPRLVAVDPEGFVVVFTILTHHPLLSLSNDGILTLEGDLASTIVNATESLPSRFVYSAIATDSGVPPLSSPFTITIEYDRQDSHIPSFTPRFVDGEELVIPVAENTFVGSMVGTPLRVDTGEEQNPVLFFTIQSCHPSCPVVIHSSRGQFTLITMLDFESVPVYGMNVTVTNGVTSDSIYVRIVVEDEDDCQVDKVIPMTVSVEESQIRFEGVNLSPLGVESSESGVVGTLVTGVDFSVSYAVRAHLRDHHNEAVSNVLLRNCSILSYSRVVLCTLPMSMGYNISWSLEWQSTVPHSILHHCAFASEAATSNFRGVEIEEVSGSVQMATSGSSVCFRGTNMGTASLYNTIPHRDAIQATVTLVDSSVHPLSSCSYSVFDTICCSTGSGYGSTAAWSLCLYGRCSSREDGGFRKPRITSVSSSSTLSSAGGNVLLLEGTNFGDNMDVVHVFMMDDGVRTELPNCHYRSEHTKLECRSVEGAGSQLTFVVQVADQISDPFVSSLAYALPVITSVYGPGAQNASTAGGQVIFVTGENLGIEEKQSILLYGKAPALSFRTHPCHVVMPNILLRCVSVAGSGFQNEWMVSVGNQTSAVYRQDSSIYGYPVVTSINPLNDPIPTAGGTEVVVTGLNFGMSTNDIVVEYVNEDGVVFTPVCNLVQNHTQLRCNTVPGYGNSLSWSIEVRDLRSVDLFTMSYASPVVTSLSCGEFCGSVGGGDVVTLFGSNFGPTTQTVTATYGFSGTEFTALDCVIVSNSEIECVTSPGVGQRLHWRVQIGSQEAECSSFVTYSYVNTTLAYASNQPVSMNGKERASFTVSNDFTFCRLCSFVIHLNGGSTEGEILNRSTVRVQLPSIHSSSLVASLTIRYAVHIVETTNTVVVPLRDPTIESYMIERSKEEDSSFLLSLFGRDFGFEKSLVTITIGGKATALESCILQTVTDDYASCYTIHGSGTVYLTRSTQVSNTLAFSLEDVSFATDNFTTSIDGYLQYPSRFHTIGGELFEVSGERIPLSSTVTFGREECRITHINATHLSCLVPSGEGEHLPVRILDHQRVLLQVYASYYAPEITTVSPSVLSYESTSILLEGEDFGLNPEVELSGILSGEVVCALRVHSHTYIECTPEQLDAIGLVITVKVGGQLSNAVTVRMGIPEITSTRIVSEDGTVLDGVPTGGNAVVVLQGQNLDAASLECWMNGRRLLMLSHNSTQVVCAIEESFEDDATFSIRTGVYTATSATIPYLPPAVRSITPLRGRTMGGERVVIEGSNFGCSSERHLGSPRVIFGREIISHWSLTTCTHERIEFLSPEGQGVQIPVTVERFNQSTIPFFFDYEPPQIDFITSSTWSNNDTPSMGSDLKIEQYILTLVGDNLGNRDTDVMISDEECAILQQNHTMIRCISPIFFGGSHPVQVVVSHQVSNIVDYEFPSLEVTSVDPLVVESIGATLFIHAEHIPPATRIPLTVSIGSVNTSNCHISLSSNFDEPFIECHLPELRRGRWPLALFVDSVAIPISQPFSILTVICGVNQYAAVGAFCTSCPENAVCPANATLPMAPAGSWTTNGTEGVPPSVDRCFNPYACLGNNQCRQGYYSYKCSQCEKGYSRYNVWTCNKCPGSLGRIGSVLLWVLVCALLYAATLSRYSTFFTWYSVMIETFQLMGILSVFRDHFSPLIAPVMDFFSLFVLDTDLFKLDCVFPSMSQQAIWVASLVTIGLLFLIDILVRAINSLRRSIKRSHMDLGGVLAQMTQLLSVMLLPILFHSLQSLSCNNKYYMADHSVQFSGLTMCYKHANYWWILVVSLVSLVVVVAMVAASAHRVAKERRFFANYLGRKSHWSKPLMDYLDASVRPGMLRLGHPFTAESVTPVFVSLLLKTVLVSVLILLREEDHLQSLLLLACTLTSVVYWIVVHPYKTTRCYIVERITRTTVEEESSESEKKKQGETPTCFTHEVHSQRRWLFNENLQWVCSMLVFFLLFVVLSKQTTVTTSISVIILILLAALIGWIGLNGVSEMVERIRHMPLGFFNMIKEEVKRNDREEVTLKEESGEASVASLESTMAEENEAESANSALEREEEVVEAFRKKVEN